MVTPAEGDVPFRQMCTRHGSVEMGDLVISAEPIDDVMTQ